MADETTFERQPGTLSLRIRPDGWVAPEGEWVFAFGSDEAGWTGRFEPDDHVEVSQTGATDGARFVRQRARLRGPADDLPTGWTWEAYASIDGTEVWVYELIPGTTRDLNDLTLTTRGHGSDVDLVFGLRAVGPGTAAAELEIPAFYLDAITLDTTDALIVANRSPEPDATQVPVDEAIQFDLMDGSGAPDASETQVYVEGVLAYDGTAGGAQPGYGVTVSTPDTGVVRFRIILPYAMDSLRVMDVRVVTANVAATRTLDASWSFTIEDLTAPRVASAVSIDHMTVRVTFDEPVSGATVASSYTFERLEAPSVAIAAVSVEQVTDTVYDVTLDVPITRGVLYRVTVADVVDSFENEIEAPWDRFDFYGYECPVPTGRRSELWLWLPEMNRLADTSRDLYRFVSVLQEVFDLLICDVDRWTDILDVDLAAERYLDQMLIGLGNPFAFTLTEAEKRRLILILVEIYRLKGTEVGIVAVVRFFLGIEIEILAYLAMSGWILGESDLGEDTDLGPGTSRERFSFEVIAPVVLTEDQRERLEQIVEYMKPAHTHLVRIVEPEEPDVIDHLELGLSELGEDEWMLHG